jgi:hypothetical protein
MNDLLKSHFTGQIYRRFNMKDEFKEDILDSLMEGKRGKHG